MAVIMNYNDIILRGRWSAILKSTVEQDLISDDKKILGHKIYSDITHLSLQYTKYHINTAVNAVV